jgi:hypothetical protein
LADLFFAFYLFLLSTKVLFLFTNLDFIFRRELNVNKKLLNIKQLSIKQYLKKFKLLTF